VPRANAEGARGRPAPRRAGSGAGAASVLRGASAPARRRAGGCRARAAPAEPGRSERANAAARLVVMAIRLVGYAALRRTWLPAGDGTIGAARSRGPSRAARRLDGRTILARTSSEVGDGSGRLHRPCRRRFAPARPPAASRRPGPRHDPARRAQRSRRPPSRRPRGPRRRTCVDAPTPRSKRPVEAPARPAREGARRRVFTGAARRPATDVPAGRCAVDKRSRGGPRGPVRWLEPCLLLAAKARPHARPHALVRPVRRRPERASGLVALADARQNRRHRRHAGRAAHGRRPRPRLVPLVSRRALGGRAGPRARVARGVRAFDRDASPSSTSPARGARLRPSARSWPSRCTRSRAGRSAAARRRPST
jgi:hypothetical protein